MKTEIVSDQEGKKKKEFYDNGVIAEFLIEPSQKYKEEEQRFNQAEEERKLKIEQKMSNLRTKLINLGLTEEETKMLIKG